MRRLYSEEQIKRLSSIYRHSVTLSMDGMNLMEFNLYSTNPKPIRNMTEVTNLMKHNITNTILVTDEASNTIPGIYMDFRDTQNTIYYIDMYGNQKEFYMKNDFNSYSADYVIRV